MTTTELYEIHCINIQLVQSLLASDIPAYTIEQETGMSRATICKIRNNEISLANITVKNLIALDKFAKKHIINTK